MPTRRPVAALWHERVRQAFQTYFGRGHVASDFVSAEEAGRRRPLYVLSKAAAS